MKFLNYLLTALLLLQILSCSRQPDADRFSLWDGKHLKEVKSSLKSPASPYRAAYEKLIADAGKALKEGPYSVTFKEVVPPGGTKNDYLSMGPYWWPDPSKPDGLPYIRRDGEVNPESGLDRTQMRNMVEGVRVLSLAWYFTRDRQYAEKAAELLRVWFVDKETLMNPHLEYGQAIPGRTTGRGIGIIDTKAFSTLVDAIILVEASGALKKSEEEVIRTWFAAFFEWLTTSQHGKDEDVYINNHSVAYDVQVTSIARYLGNDAYVQQKISAIPAARMEHMIKADGRQPHELIRTRAFSYSVSNLGNFFDNGEIGLKVGVDIFSHVNAEGGSLQKALEFLVDYLGRESDWPWEQITDWEQTENSLGLLVRRAARYYNNPEYQIIWEQTFSKRMGDHWTLLTTPGLN